MQAFLWKLVTIMLNWFLTKGLDRLINWFNQRQLAQEREQTNKVTREKLNQDIVEGKSDEEISQSLEDALNSTKR